MPSHDPPDPVQEGTDLTVEERSVIDTWCEMLLTATHYDLLGVSREAERRAIRDAYFGLSRKFHPDVFFGRQLGPYRARIEEIFRAITRAYDVLGNARQRAGYDLHLSSLTSHPPPPLELPSMPATIPPAPAIPAEAAAVQNVPHGTLQGVAAGTLQGAREAPPVAPGSSGQTRGSGRFPPRTPQEPAQSFQPDTTPFDRPAINPSAPPVASAPVAPAAIPPANVPHALGPQTLPGAGVRRNTPAATPRQSTLIGLGNARPGESPVIPPPLRQTPAPPPPGPLTVPPPPTGVRQSQPYLDPAAAQRARELMARKLGAPPPSPRGPQKPMMPPPPAAPTPDPRVLAEERKARVDKLVAEAEEAQKKGDLAAALEGYKAAAAVNREDESLKLKVEQLAQLVLAAQVGEWIEQAREAARQGRVDASARLWEKAWEARPTDATLLLNAAEVLSKRKEEQKRAVDFAQRALLVDPKLTRAWVLLANVFLDAGLRASARGAIENVAKLDPKSPLVKELRDRMGPPTLAEQLGLRNR